MTDPPHPVRAAPSGVLRRVWPYAVVGSAGVLLWFIVWGAHVQTIPSNADEETIGLTGAVMLLDVVLGVVAIVVLPLRRRAPLMVALVTSVALIVSASAIGAAVVAVVHLAIVGTRTRLVLSGAVWTLAFLGNGVLVFPALGTSTSTTEAFVILLVGVLFYAVLVAIGRYRRARTETLALLRERAEHAEAERERDVKTAQEAERLRIAREMHDVLAHRMSLVSMHAGALTYRDDLPREKITEAAYIIQESTALALTELRGLLGVLRDTDERDPRDPQPLLQHLPILLAETRAAGLNVEVEYSGIDTADGQPVTTGLSEATSRAGYRIVQEALTNARKHAPGEAVRLCLEHSGDQLTITSRNKLPRKQDKSTGHGLVGLTERAQLAGGTLTVTQHSGEFVVEGRLPWD